MKKSIDVNKIIIIILLVLMLLPSNFSNLHITIPKIDSIVILILFIYLLRTRSKDVRELVKNNKFIIANCIFFVAIMLSLIVNHKTIKMNDFFEPIKYIVFPMVTTIIMIICRQKEYYIFLLKIISIVMIAVCIFGIIQYFDVFSINELYIKSYAPTQYKTLVNDYPNPRIVGIKSNPAVYGMLMSIGVYFNLMYFKYTKHKSICIISILLCVINLMLTLTRTIQIAFFCSIISYIFIYVLYKKGLKKASIITLLAIAILILLICILPNSITWRLTQVLHFSNATSWLGRTAKWEKYFEIISQNILFGIGPVKNHIAILNYIDSELVQNLLQYGIVGFVTYILILISPLFDFIKNRTNKKIIQYYIPIAILILINNISSSSLINFETAIGIYIIVGLILINYKEKETNE